MGEVAYELGFREWVGCSHSEIGEIAFPNGGDIIGKGLKEDTRSRDGIKCWADPCGNAQGWNETFNMPKPQGHTQRHKKKALNSKRTKRTQRLEQQGLFRVRSVPGWAMELDQSSDASSTLNTCVIVDKLRNLRSWLSHLRGPYLADRYRMKGDNRDEAPGSCQAHSL